MKYEHVEVKNDQPTLLMPEPEEGGMYSPTPYSRVKDLREGDSVNVQRTDANGSIDETGWRVVRIDRVESGRVSHIKQGSDGRKKCKRFRGEVLKITCRKMDKEVEVEDGIVKAPEQTFTIRIPMSYLEPIPDENGSEAASLRDRLRAAYQRWRGEKR